ncbi:MAG: permease, partial [Clostridiales bacterium]|nr:permease [Clostridiales bacterium]
MTIPAWVVTGLLDSGKTTLINRLIEQELEELDVLVLQFESGVTPLTEQERVKKLVFSKSQLEQIPFGVAETIIRYLDKYSPDLILIEWNGMEHFHKMEEMFLQFTAKMVLSIETVVYAADSAAFKARIPDAGAAAFSQIAGSDCAYIRLKGHRQKGKEMDVLYECNPDIRVYTDRKWERFVRAMFHFGMKPRHWFLIILAAVTCYMLFFPLLNGVGFPMGRYVSIFLGVFLQAAPFLAIGVLLSSMIQVYLKPDWIQRMFPRKILAGQLFAVAAGFCLPVCDCASIPVFRSLVKKGVPMPAAVTFMLVSPVINPVVILSTWYAFNGDVRIIAARCGLGVLCAVLCGFTYLFKTPGDDLLEQAIPLQAACQNYSLPIETDTRLSRFFLMMRHAQNEFFSVGKFLLTGIFVSTLF